MIDNLKATVKVDGRIKVDGRGLLLSGGNNIGFAGGQSVKAPLICDAAGTVLHDSALVPLAPNGDFRINDVLLPWPPASCGSPVLLIRNTGGAWFAAGIPDLDTDDDD